MLRRSVGKNKFDVEGWTTALVDWQWLSVGVCWDISLQVDGIDPFQGDGGKTWLKRYEGRYMVHTEARVKENEMIDEVEKRLQRNEKWGNGGTYSCAKNIKMLRSITWRYRY